MNINASSTLEPLIELLRIKLGTGLVFSEFDLMRWLQAPEQGIFLPDALSHNKTLFQSHFLLMHALYKLKQEWLKQRTAVLEISALHIEKRAWHCDISHDSQVGEADAVMDYYLDLNNLDTSEKNIEQLLNSFWLKMRIPEQHPEDFAILELTPPVSASQIKAQYRKLAMQHHPDRGGCEQTFCQIQSAYQRLRTQYL